MANATTKHAARIPDARARKLVGEKVYYVPTGNKITCPTCGTVKTRGMLSRFENTLYCTEGCVLVAANK